MKIKEILFVIFVTKHFIQEEISRIIRQMFTKVLIQTLFLKSHLEMYIVSRDCCIKNVTNIIFKGITDLINKKNITMIMFEPLIFCQCSEYVEFSKIWSLYLAPDQFL